MSDADQTPISPQDRAGEDDPVGPSPTPAEANVTPPADGPPAGAASPVADEPVRLNRKARKARARARRAEEGDSSRTPEAGVAAEVAEPAPAAPTPVGTTHDAVTTGDPSTADSKPRRAARSAPRRDAARAAVEPGAVQSDGESRAPSPGPVGGAGAVDREAPAGGASGAGAARPRIPRLVDTPGPDPATPPSQVRLTVGTIVGVHGVEGELKLRLATDDPEHLATIQRVYVGDEPRARRLLGVRLHAGQALLRLQGVVDPEGGHALRGQRVRIDGRDARPLAPGEYFLYQLVGLAAVDEAEAALGRVTDVIETGAHDVFVVTPADGGVDLLVPNLPDVVLEIDPRAGRLVVRPLVYDN